MNTRATYTSFMRFLLAVLMLLSTQTLYADYDPDVEIQRLIDQASEEKTKAEAGVRMLIDKREKLKATFIELNTTQKQIADLLYKVRMTDARNKAMMLIKTGLLFKTAIDAPRSLTATVTDIFVMVGSDYLQNNYPELFDTSAHQLTASFASEGIKAVDKLNWMISLDDMAMAGMIRNETPELSKEKGALSDLITAGKLPDDLIALKRAEYILKAGTEAENAIQAVKAELLKKQSVILAAIARLEMEVQRRDEDIRSWQRNREVGRSLRAIPPIPQPQPVNYGPVSSMSFSAAANQIRNAVTQLKANKVDCNGYNMLVFQAEAAAYQYLHELFLQQVWSACNGSWSSDACRAANQRFDATVRQDFTAQITGAQKANNEQFANEKPNVEAFRSRLQAWESRQVTVPYFGYMKTNTLEPGTQQNGADAAFGVWRNSEIGLPPSYLDAYYSEMQIPYGMPPLLEAIEKSWNVANEHVKDLDHDLKLANRADADARALAQEADTLAKEWEPNLYYWGCIGLLGQGIDEARLRQLKAFRIGFEGQANTGKETAQRYVQAAKERLTKLSGIASAYRAEGNLLRTQHEASQIRDKLLAWYNNGVSLRSPGIGYALWSMMTREGVTAAMIEELREAVPKLKSEAFALKYVLEAESRPETRRRPVLESSGVTNLRDNLKQTGAFLVPVYNDYQSLYPQLQRKQSELDQGYRTLRSTVEGVLGEPAESIVAPQLLDRAYLIDASDFPDPTAGVFEQLDEYEKLANQYHTILDPLHPASFALVRPMDDLIKKLERERGGLMGLSESAFSQGINVFSSEAVSLANRAFLAGGRSRMNPQALFNKSYNKLMLLISEVGGAYTQGKKAAEITGQLTQLISSVSDYLARPESAGGAGAAVDWVQAIDAVLAPGSEANQLRSSGGIAGLLDQLATLQVKLKRYQSSGGDVAVRKLYQDFTEAYQAKALGRVTRFLTADWKASDGSDLTDLEDILGNSFRVFDRVQFSISNLAVKPAGGGEYQVSYTVTITGQIYNMNMKHQESATVEDVVVLTLDGAKIKATRGGRLWLQ